MERANGTGWLLTGEISESKAETEGGYGGGSGLEWLQGDTITAGCTVTPPPPALLCCHRRSGTAPLFRYPFRPSPASQRLVEFEVAGKLTFTENRFLTDPEGLIPFGRNAVSKGTKTLTTPTSKTCLHYECQDDAEGEETRPHPYQKHKLRPRHGPICCACPSQAEYKSQNRRSCIHLEER
jgi:hypothetical protein